MSEVVLCCPLPGPPPEYSGDCGSCKTHTWSSPGLGELYFFTPYVNEQLVSFEFIPISNNGSSIVVELFYCSDGVCRVYETWNLGTLTTAVKKYSVINFGSNPIFNTLELRITTTNGTLGEFNVCLDCEIPVVFMPFCTGFTYNAEQEACECTDELVYLFAEENELLPGEFPLNLKGYGWFLDADLQIPAPCGDYMINETTIFRYNCNDSSSEVISFCDDCTVVQCSAETKSVTYQHNGTPFLPPTFTKSNPYIFGYNGGSDRGVHFYSEQCVNIVVGPDQLLLGYLEITLSYTGNPDSVVATVSDPVAPDGSVGVISFSPGQPPVSMFQYANPDTLIKVKNLANQITIYVTLPQSRAIKVRLLAGYKINNLTRPSVTTRISWTDCGTPITGYTFGLHTYSAWDSIVEPRLRTTLYAFEGSPYTWSVGDTVFSDRYLTQPAFPYFYGYSGNGTNQTVIKVGEYYRREWGTKKYYRSSQLRFRYKLESVISDYQKYDRIDVNNEYRVETCIDPFMDIGKITSITPINQLLEPEVYYYLVGRHPTAEWASNNDYFFRTDFTSLLSKKTGKKVPLTGMQHALWRNSEALAAGVNKYILGFDDAATEEIRRKKGRLVSRIIAWGAVVTTAALIVAGFIVNPAETAKTLGSFILGKVAKDLKLGKVLNFIAGLGQVAKSLGRALSRAGISGSGQKYKTGKGPLQWLVHTLFHRHKGVSDPHSKCPYVCKPDGLGAKKELGYKGLDLGLAVALQGLDRLYTSGYTRTYREQCEEFYGRYTTTPYVFSNNYLYKFPGLTGADVGYNCDGAYMYTVNSSSVVVTKRNAYKSEFKKRFLAPDKEIRVETPLPDVPRFVTSFNSLIFLPYTSGRPYKYFEEGSGNFYKGANFNGLQYSNTEQSTSYTSPSYMVGELNNPLPITMTIPEDYFYSSISQEDANNKAILYISGYTAATRNIDISAENKPGVTEDEFLFSHRLENGIYLDEMILAYQSITNSGVQVGTKLYYDYDGVHSCLTGYYITPNSGETYYKKFYEVNSGGTVLDIWTMFNQNDTTVTSQETSQVVSLETEFSAYTSAWFFTGEEPEDANYMRFYNKHNFNEIWATTEFYNSPYLTRGFMDNDGGNIFYTYNSNLFLNEGYSIAERQYYRNIDSYNVFIYVTDYIININMTQVCVSSGATSGNTGVLFSLEDISGNPVSSIYGLTLNAQITYNGVANTTHEITFGDNEYEYFLPLDPNYQQNIGGVTITEYLTPNPYNTIYFTAGTFNSCTVTCDCYYYDVVTYEEDVLRASGNTDSLKNGVVYVTYRNCDDSGFTNETFDNTASPYQNAICVNGLAQYNPPSIFIWQDDVQRTDILSFLTKQSCCQEATPTPTVTQTSTPTPTITNTPEVSQGPQPESPTPTPTVTQTSTPTTTVTESNTPTPTVTNTLSPTITPSVTPNAVCPEQFVLTYSGNNPAGFSGYSGTYDRLYSYTGGSFTVGYYDSLPSQQFVVGPDASGDSYSVFGRNNGSTYYTIIGLSQSTPDNVISWYVLRSTGDYAINGAAVAASVQIGATSDNGILSGGIYFPPTGRIAFSVSSIWYRNYPSVCPTPTVTPTPTQTPIQSGDTTPTPTPTLTPTPSSVLTTIFLSVCYDSVIPQDDFIVDFNFYTQSSGDSCGADQTLPLDNLQIAFEVYPNSPNEPVSGFFTMTGTSCQLVTGEILGDTITGLTITSISTPNSNNANYVVGTICSSGSCVPCSVTPTPTPTQTLTPTQTTTQTPTPTLPFTLKIESALSTVTITNFIAVDGFTYTLTSGSFPVTNASVYGTHSSTGTLGNSDVLLNFDATTTSTFTITKNGTELVNFPASSGNNQQYVLGSQFSNILSTDVMVLRFS